MAYFFYSAPFMGREEFAQGYIVGAEPVVQASREIETAIVVAHMVYYGLLGAFHQLALAVEDAAETVGFQFAVEGRHEIRIGCCSVWNIGFSKADMRLAEAERSQNGFHGLDAMAAHHPFYCNGHVDWQGDIGS